MDVVKLFLEKQNSLQNIDGINYFYIHEHKPQVKYTVLSQEEICIK